MDKRKRILKSRKFVRHKKKNWRKHCDVSEIEEWFEERRKQEASGLKPASERTDAELFHIDQEPIDTEQVRKTSNFNLLKSERFALPDTTVPPVMPPLTKKSKKIFHMETDEGYNDSSDDEYSTKQLTYARRSKSLADVVRNRKNDLIEGNVCSERTMNIWADEGCESNMKVAKRCNLHSTGFSAPHPGTSYNPTYTDHQWLLKKALQAEVNKVQAEEKLQRALNHPRMTAAEREKQWQLEMLEGLETSSNEPKNKQFDNEQEELDPAVVKRPIKAANRKTLKQRRKERLARKAARSKKQQHLEKVQLSEVYRLRSLKKEIQQNEEKIKSLSLKRQETRTKRQLKRTKRLGKHPYEKLPIDVKLSDEMYGSLRLLQTEGNNARDQYNSILKRNMAVPKGPSNPTRFHKHKPSVRWTVSRAYDLRPEQLQIK